MTPSCLLNSVRSAGRLCAAQVMHTKRTLHAKIIQRERQRQATMAAEKAAAAGPGSEAGAGAGKTQQAKKRARSGGGDGWDEEDGSDSASSSGEEGWRQGRAHSQPIRGMLPAKAGLNQPQELEAIDKHHMAAGTAHQPSDGLTLILQTGPR